MKATEITEVISSKSFSDAINWIQTHLRNPEIINMGDRRIARFKVAESEFSHIMFFDHSGIASRPSYCFND